MKSVYIKDQQKDMMSLIKFVYRGTPSITNSQAFCCKNIESGY